MRRHGQGRGPGYCWRAQVGKALDAGDIDEHCWGWTLVGDRWARLLPLSALYTEAHDRAKGVARAIDKS